MFTKKLLRQLLVWSLFLYFFPIVPATDTGLGK